MLRCRSANFNVPQFVLHVFVCIDDVAGTESRFKGIEREFTSTICLKLEFFGDEFRTSKSFVCIDIEWGKGWESVVKSLQNIVVVLLVSLTCAVADAQEDGPENANEPVSIVLDVRKTPDYNKSAFSFRYNSQDVAVHKNYVDIVYSANLHIRINNHGGLESRIVDLGETPEQGFHVDGIDDERWQTRQIRPVGGHYYLHQVVEEGNEMLVIFRVDEVDNQTLQITGWARSDQQAWPVSLERRGAAGTSGMNRPDR